MSCGASLRDAIEFILIASHNRRPSGMRGEVSVEVEEDVNDEVFLLWI